MEKEGMRRFCWRERSEKLNWRLLGALDVADVVRRGDPAELEPYALHVTFARLPAARDPTTHDAWFLVRLLQLSMEYLLFTRARDGDVLESLSEELRLVERERDELVANTHKWKARSRSGEKQVEKLHQVLQNIAKLLQIHGASPSAVSTIETLLTELITERKARQRRKAVENVEPNDELRPTMQEARVCGFCGKLFSSAEYLDNHLARRHPGESLEMETPIKCKVRKSIDDSSFTRKNEEPTASELAMQKMVQQVEQALHTHEDHLRSLAKEASQKVQQVYEQLHTETQLVEDLKAKRWRIEEELEDSKLQLEKLHQSRQQAEEELADMKEQLQFVTMKQKMMGVSPPAYARNDELSAAEAEIKSLQQTLEMVNAELDGSRDELAQLQAAHLSLLREKEVADTIQPSEPPRAEQHETWTQTELPPNVDKTMQTEDLEEQLQFVAMKKLSAAEAEIKSLQQTLEIVNAELDGSRGELTRLQAGHLAILREKEVADTIQPNQSLCVEQHETWTQTELLPGADKTMQAEDTIEALNNLGDGDKVVFPDSSTQTGEEPIPDYVQQIHIQELLRSLADRAESAATIKATTLSVPTDSSKTCSSIARHKFVRSRFQHDEVAVKERVASCLQQLEQFSSRFGVPGKNAWLSNENSKLVQQALHGHLEVLPSDVLAKMIDCENAVNTLIEKVWVPMEKTRQQALERFKMETRAKSEASQGLVRQAMAAYGLSEQTELRSGIVTNDVLNTESTAEKMVQKGVESPRLSALSLTSSDPVPVRRYPANNQLTVVIEGEVLTEGTPYLGTSDALSAVEDNVAHGIGEVETEDLLETHSLSNDEQEEKPESLADDLGSSVRKSSNVLSMDTGIVVGDRAGTTVDESVVPVQQSTDEGEQGNDSDVVAADRSREMDLFPGMTSQDEKIGINSVGEYATIGSRQSVPIKVQPVHQRVVEDAEKSNWQPIEEEESSVSQLPQEPPSPSQPARVSENVESVKSVHSVANSIESERLSVVSDFAPADSGHLQSIAASSEMSFGASLPSLGMESSGVEESISASTTKPRADKQQQEEEDARSALESAPEQNQSAGVVICSVMSFDDSDIEEVLLE